MRKWFLFSLCLSSWAVFASPQTELDSLLLVLDNELTHVQDYFDQRDGRITSLKQTLANPEIDDNHRIVLLKDLFTEYKSYQADSAISYLQKRLEWAFAHQNQRLIDESRLLQIDYYASIGLYPEAVEVVGLVDTARLSESQYLDYLEATAHLYGEMASYSQDRFFSQIHMRRSNHLHERLLARLDPNSPRYLRTLEGLLWYHTPDKAMEINERLMQESVNNNQEMAMCCFMRALAYERKRDLDQARIWYARSAVADLRAGITDNGSSWKLAQLMNEANDVERAYRYARYSMENALFYHARIRQAQVANSWAIIEKQYQEEMMARHRHMQITLLIVSLLAVVALVVMIVVAVQRRKIARMQRQLKEANDRLTQSNAS
ncbi:MAG: hypothetical protein J6Z12_04465, partial [Paludibacteraceae bacterium]|nr:hypothetical protein [Paludibacteraceae bacterium]